MSYDYWSLDKISNHFVLAYFLLGAGLDKTLPSLLVWEDGYREYTMTTDEPLFRKRTVEKTKQEIEKQQWKEDSHQIFLD